MELPKEQRNPIPHVLDENCNRGQWICFIALKSRGGLWSPHSWLVSLLEVSELLFRKHTNKDRVTRLPVDKIVIEALSSSLVKSLWCNIVANCDVEISKECQSLCLENIVKLYVTVRCFSFAKDIVNKYVKVFSERRLCGKT